MRGRVSTKALVIGALTTVIVGIATVGTVTFLKDSGEASAAEEQNIINTLPVAGSDNENLEEDVVNSENQTAEQIEQNGETQENANESVEEIEDDQPIAPTTRPTTPTEPEETTIIENRLVSETMTWRDIKLNGTIAKTGISYINLNYRIEYYYDGELDEEKTEKGRSKYNEEISEYPDKVIEGYKFSEATVDEEKPLIVTENEAENVIKVYYIKRTDLSYTVYYKEQGTEKEVAESKTVGNQTFEDIVEETAIDVEGYNKVDPTTANIKITTGVNEYTFYYTKRTDLSYTVYYKEQGTEKEVAESKTVGNQTFDDIVEETAIDVEGYNKVDPTTANIKITTGVNEYTFYYTKRTDLSYTVYYKEQGTEKEVAESKTVGNQTFDDIVEETAIDVEGYNKVDPTTANIKITTGVNEYTFYYTKRTDLSYTVNYLEKGTNEVLHEAKIVENQTFGEKITASIDSEAETVEKPVVITGYSCVEVDKNTMTIAVNGNLINFYYTKNEYEYTVEHYWEGLNGQWEKDEISFPDEVKSALYEDVITTYTVHQRAGYVLSHATPPDNNTTEVSLTITENESTNKIQVYYVRNNFSYTVKHYTEKLDGTWELRDTDSVENVKFGANATYESNIYKGFTFDDSKTTPKNATVPANNDLVIKLYYTRKLCDYTVNFFIQGEQTPFKTYSNSAKLGEVITVSQHEIDTTKNEIPNGIIYEYIPGTTSVTIIEGENIINIYYKEIIKTATVTENSTTIRKTNLVIVLDLSSSMANGTTRLANAKTAANNFIDQIYNNETVSGINIKVITFNSRNPKIISTNYIGITECTNGSHYHEYLGSLGTNCKYIDGKWYSEYEEEHNYAAFSGTQVLPVAGLTNNMATSYSEAQALKQAINGIYIPSQYQYEGYGTHIYAALQAANTQMANLNATYGNNDSVVVFLGDGVPSDPILGGDYSDNSNENINAAATTLKENATVYCIRLGREAQNSTVFNTIATSSDKILDANTEGDLINGFSAITAQENSRTFTSNNSSNGIITITGVDLNITPEKPLTVTKSDGTTDTFTTVETLNASGYISYAEKTITWDIKNYSKETVLTINYHIN